MSSSTLITMAGLALGAVAVFIFGGKKEPEQRQIPSYRDERAESTTNQSQSNVYSTSQYADDDSRKPVSQERPRDSAFPPDWEIRSDSFGRWYYYHPGSGTCTFTRPTSRNSFELIFEWKERRTKEAAAVKQRENELKLKQQQQLQQQQLLQQRLQERIKAVPRPISLLIHHEDFKDKDRPVCGLHTCSRASKIRCGCCLDALYCCEDHQREDWKGHAANCTSFVSFVANQLKFSVAKMHTQLHPRRGSNVDPYDRWPLNVFAHFNCSRCSRSISKHQKKQGNDKRPPTIRWASAKAAIELSLKKMSIVRVYRQKCKHCDAEALPMITEEELYRKIGSILRWMRDLQDDDHNPREDNFSPTDPHLPELCEKCGFGTNPHAH